MAWSKEQAREYRRNWGRRERECKAQEGLCRASNCENPVPPGVYQCAECKETLRVWAQKRRQRWREAGRCSNCGRERPPGYEKAMCPRCLLRASLRDRRAEQNSPRGGTKVSTIKQGVEVTLHTPDNPRLHGAPAVVERVTDWGAHVRTPASATGKYRALFSEMLVGGPAPGATGYSGDFCSTCGGDRMRRTGSCLTCDDCGANSGCG